MWRDIHLYLMRLSEHKASSVLKGQKWRCICFVSLSSAVMARPEPLPLWKLPYCDFVTTWCHVDPTEVFYGCCVLWDVAPALLYCETLRGTGGNMVHNFAQSLRLWSEHKCSWLSGYVRHFLGPDIVWWFRNLGSTSWYGKYPITKKHRVNKHHPNGGWEWDFWTNQRRMEQHLGPWSPGPRLGHVALGLSSAERIKESRGVNWESGFAWDMFPTFKRYPPSLKLTKDIAPARKLFQQETNLPTIHFQVRKC